MVVGDANQSYIAMSCRDESGYCSVQACVCVTAAAVVAEGYYCLATQGRADAS